MSEFKGVQPAHRRTRSWSVLSFDNPRVSALATFLFRTRLGQGRGAREEERLESFLFFPRQAGGAEAGPRAGSVLDKDIRLRRQF